VFYLEIFTLFKSNKADNLINMFIIKAKIVIMELASYMTCRFLKKSVHVFIFNFNIFLNTMF